MEFHYLARAIIYANDQVLLAHQLGAENTFLPGGHIGMGEKADVALIREIAEEIGKEAIIERFIGAVEATWKEDDHDNYEINLVFQVHISDIDPNSPPQSKESHLEFLWAKPEQLVAYNLLPQPMRDCLTNLKSGYHGFWGSDL
jgi:8-oxo-dGTP pyrophosphatase MutT (NUDIX family)